MHAASSSSRPLSEETKKPVSPPTPTPTPPPPKVTRRKGAEFIDDERKRKMTQSKRSEGLIKKAKDDHSLTRAPVAVITFDGKDKLCSFGSPSVEEVFLKYLCIEYDQQVIPKKWLDRAKKESDSYKTKEECMSMINCLCERLKELKNSPSVNASAGQGSGIGAGRDRSAGNSNPMCPVPNFAAAEGFLDEYIELLSDPFYSALL